MRSSIIENIISKIEKGEEISPFLFTWQAADKLNFEVESLAYRLLEEYSIDKMSFLRLKDDWTNLKIKDVKEFMAQSEKKPRFKFQIFYIENIWRFTLKSANSCLKVFEEPWVWNLIFLTNASEAWVLNTILSRVQTIDKKSSQISEKSEFYYWLIDRYLKDWDIKLLSYFFTSKLEKQEYISFLKTLFIYIKDNLILINLLDELEEDINLVEKNNLLPKYVVDKYMLKIKS